MLCTAKTHKYSLPSQYSNLFCIHFIYKSETIEFYHLSSVSERNGMKVWIGFI